MWLQSRPGLVTRKQLCSTPSYRIRGNLSQLQYIFLWDFIKKSTVQHNNCCDLNFSDSSGETGAELSEIDARLQALQEYMRDLDTGH